MTVALPVDVSHAYILCAFCWVIVCVISSSEAGHHSQTSANLECVHGMKLREVFQANTGSPGH